MELPYKTEYAKSGRASCKGCKAKIDQGELRLAVMVQSPHFDGMTPNWYHLKCFFIKQRPRSVDDIEQYESLRIEDQKKLKKLVDESAAIIVPDKKGKKRAAGETVAKKKALKDFVIEYSKSSRAICRGCDQKIIKDQVRISKKDFETDVGKRYGGQDMWHHLTCFAKLRSELGYYESADKLPGFLGLSKEDQKEAKTQLRPIKQEDVPDVKKPKLEDEDDKEYKAQNKLMYKNRDELKALDKKELSAILEHSEQEIAQGIDGILDRLADYMTFGAIEPCTVCKGGQFVFGRDGYRCQGDLTEWTKCTNVVKEPARKALKIPNELKEKFPFLKKYKYKPMTRVIKNFNPTAAAKPSVKKEDEVDAPPKVERSLPPLYDMEFVIVGKAADKEDIVKLGGKVASKMHEKVMALIATPADVEKMSTKIEQAESMQIQVVSQDFVKEAKKHAGKIPELIINKSICDWGTDPSQRLPDLPSVSKSKSKSKSRYASKMPSKVKLRLVNGTALDPELDHMADTAHVYQDGETKYTVVLSRTDVVNNRNSYYKIQLIESNKRNKYWVFRAWGRIGTSIGDTRLEDMGTLQMAKKHFEEIYEERTGNYWERRDCFVKVPGRYYPMDVDYGDAEAANENMSIVDSDSKLKKEVQDLVRLIFDVNKMKSLMMEFELDMEKMPLGKLSRTQIQNAYKVLTECQQLIDRKETVEAHYIDCTNRFYTFIPHSFGMDNPPLLKDKEIIQQKIDMLDNLMELEVAYSLMKSTDGDKTVDKFYDQLKTEIDVLHKESEEFKIIQEYVKNTHATTHTSYQLEIDEVFVVKRQGEEKRFKPFKKLHNRKLLWHGSRITNFAGILSQGLRKAPPEAPVTGYMFGKGIYFADMVSKSANYCCTSPDNSTGVLLLCDVALGDMYERDQAEYVEKLPKGKHSCKGVGRTEPDPAIVHKLPDGVEVPIGPGKVMSKRNKSSLLYNEYIVYDVAQVNVKYLLKLNFKYNY